MSGADFMFLDRCIQAMDGVFLEYRAEIASRQATPAPRIIRP
jgi:hypothetical protein